MNPRSRHAEPIVKNLFFGTHRSILRKGVEPASQHYYGISARRVGRQQAVELAAILPAPLRRRPERMSRYSAIILERMRQMGW